ncbi:hypothetical protein [Treponema lecithinolyticum]|uniref:Uncharacterized protein n=1 Tax=Treponema lecithinolyticum ATCC 700332 TaxID=1321815 RepID=A0ABN0NY17_TRELE|nr:hypothetical protein HMPREF9193_01439 [Treponema lecithinolyticum ATCC 700332]
MEDEGTTITSPAQVKKIKQVSLLQRSIPAMRRKTAENHCIKFCLLTYKNKKEAEASFFHVIIFTF